jgi:hypothetical protein
LFSIHPPKLTSCSNLYHGAVSLYSMGFDVSVGTVVWNQCKDILTNDDTHTRLIYSGDIKNNSLNMVHYKDSSKKIIL